VGARAGTDTVPQWKLPCVIFNFILENLENYLIFIQVTEFIFRVILGFIAKLNRERRDFF
jgi:hypothetical protein